jgi:hypothetical protein
MGLTFHHTKLENHIFYGHGNSVTVHSSFNEQYKVISRMQTVAMPTSLAVIVFWTSESHASVALPYSYHPFIQPPTLLV